MLAWLSQRDCAKILPVLHADTHDGAGVLVQRDGSISRLVLQGFWLAAIDELSKQAGGSTGTKRRKAAPDELQALRSALSDRFGQGSQEPLFVQTLQVQTCHASCVVPDKPVIQRLGVNTWHQLQFCVCRNALYVALQALALADRDSYVAPEQAASSALAANSLQAGILQVIPLERFPSVCVQYPDVTWPASVDTGFLVKASDLLHCIRTFQLCCRSSSRSLQNVARTLQHNQQSHEGMLHPYLAHLQQMSYYWAVTAACTDLSQNRSNLSCAGPRQ